MTLTQHIQEVKNDILDQRCKLDQLVQKRKASFLTMMLAPIILMFTMGQATLVVVAMLVALIAFATYTFAATNRKLSLMNKLIAQNEFYKNLIVEESYSGKDIGPTVD